MTGCESTRSYYSRFSKAKKVLLINKALKKEQYAGKMFKANKKRFAEEYGEELDKYRAAVRCFKAHPDRENAKTADLVKRHNELKTVIATEDDKLTDLKAPYTSYPKALLYWDCTDTNSDVPLLLSNLPHCRLYFQSILPVIPICPLQQSCRNSVQPAFLK